MALLADLSTQMESQNVDELVRLLSMPDGDLVQQSQLRELASGTEAEVLKSEYASDVVVQAKLARRVIAPILLQRIGPAQLLDDSRILSAVDSHGMLPRIGYLHEQMVEINERMSKSVASGGPIPSARRILAFGLGGSASGPLLAREIIQNQGYHVPLDIHTSYPGSFHGIDSDTLVIICSYSGNTEETLYALDYAQKRTQNILILSRGGKVGTLSGKYRFIEIPKSDIEAPRESIGYWLTAFWFIVSSLGLAKNDEGNAYRFDMSEIEAARSALDRIDNVCSGETPFSENPAKQYATYFLHGIRSGGPSAHVDWRHPREPMVLLDEADRAIGKRLANQFGETVEHPIWLLLFAEDAHNEIESAATFMLEDELHEGPRRRSYVFVSSRIHESPEAGHGERRAAQRIEETLKALFQEHKVDFLKVESEGNSVLERKLCLLKLLDYARLYTSILLGTNPLPTVFMEMMKRRMHKVVGTADRAFVRSLMESGKVPALKDELLAEEGIRKAFPALGETILERLIAQGYLTVDSGMLTVSEKGKELAG